MDDYDRIRQTQRVRDYAWLKELISDGTCLNARAAAVHAIGVIRQEYEDFKREAGNDMRAADADLRGLRAELAAEKERCAGIVEFHQQRYRRGQPEHVLLANIAAAIRASNAAPVDAKQLCAESNSCAEDEISWAEACAVGARIAKDREDV